MSDDNYKLGLAAGLGLLAVTEYPSLSLAWRTLPRDVRATWRLGRAMFTASWSQRNNVTMVDKFEETVKRFPNKVKGNVFFDALIDGLIIFMSLIFALDPHL